MKTKMKKLMKNQKGMTLIELLAVIVIIAIIAVIAIPMIGNIINNSRDKAVFADASNIIAAVKIAESDGVCDPAATNSTCTNTQAGIAEYVDSPRYPGFTVKKSNGIYTINYDGFNHLKKDRIYTESGANVTLEKGVANADFVNEKQLNELLGNN